MSKKLEITEENYKEIKERKQREKNIKIYKRYLFLEMKYEGKKNKDISQLLDVTVETLSNWSAIYREGGIELLSQLHYEGRRTSILMPIKEDIQKQIDEANISTIKSLKHWIKESFEIEIGSSWLHEFCKKNSIYLIKKQD